MNLPVDYSASDAETPVVVHATEDRLSELAEVTQNAAQEIEEYTGVHLSLNDRSIIKDIAVQQLGMHPLNGTYAMFQTVRMYCITYLGGMRDPASESRSYYRKRIRKAMAQFECGKRP